MESRKWAVRCQSRRQAPDGGGSSEKTLWKDQSTARLDSNNLAHIHACSHLQGWIHYKYSTATYMPSIPLAGRLYIICTGWISIILSTRALMYVDHEHCSALPSECLNKLLDQVSHKLPSRPSNVVVRVDHVHNLHQSAAGIALVAPTLVRYPRSTWCNGLCMINPN
jgi:hypothetical protein